MFIIKTIKAFFNKLLGRTQPHNAEYITGDEESQLQHDNDFAELNAVLSDLDNFLIQN